MPRADAYPPRPAQGFSLALVYLTMSFPLGCWIGRIPEIKDSLGASDTSWGLANTIATIGEVAGFIVIAVLVGRCSTRRLTHVAACALLAMGPLVGIATTLPALVSALTAWMLASKIIGTTAGALILVHQRRIGEVAFGRFDALYSIGMMMGAALSWAAIREGIPAGEQFAITNGMLAVALLLTRRHLPDEPPSPSRGRSLVARLRVRITVPLMLLALLSLLASLIDSAAAQWSGIYLARLIPEDPAAGSLGYVLVMGAKSLTLLCVGAAHRRLGWKWIALISTGGAAVLVTVGVASGSAGTGVLALIVLGMGTAFYGPMVNTLASREPGVTDGEARSVLEFGELPAYLLAPVLLGIAWALAAMTVIPLVITGALVLGSRSIEERA